MGGGGARARVRVVVVLLLAKGFVPCAGPAAGPPVLLVLLPGVVLLAEVEGAPVEAEPSTER